MDEATNKAIKEIEISTKEWMFSNLSEQLYTWFDIFNEQFFENKLKIPVVSFQRKRVNNLGHFVVGRNSLGLKWNININAYYKDLALIDTLATLLHEMIHQWQQEFGKKKGSNNNNNYHNVEFRKKARLMGIPNNQSGIILDYKSPFLTLIKSYGISLKSQLLSDHKDGKEKADAFKLTRKRGMSKLKKWSCGCTNVRVAIADFRAKCLKCNNEYHLVEGQIGSPVELVQSLMKKISF